LLGEYAGRYGDNGGDPDGNCWLPSNQDDIPASLAQKVVDAGYGSLIEVRMAADEDMHEVLGVVFTDPEDEQTFETMREAANDRLQWAHYGAYGAMDSHWVYVAE